MKPDPSKICFGLTEELDRRSLSIFLQLAGAEEFTDIFTERLSSEEILHLVDQFMALMRKHLSEQEYHRLFLQDKDHHHHH